MLSSFLSSKRLVVTIVMMLAILTMIVIALMEWVLLLFLNHIGFTTFSSSDFYIKAASLKLLVPLLYNILFSKLSNHIGPFLTLGYGYLMTAIGLFTIVIFRSSRIAFLFGFTAYSTCMTMRIIRINFLALLISREHRTSVLAIHQLMTPIGAILGSLIWYIAQLWNGEVQLYVSQRFLIIDRFFIVQGLTGLMMALAAIICFTVLRNKETSTGIGTCNTQQQEQQPLLPENHREDSEEGISSQDASISEQMEPNQNENWQLFLYLCSIILLVRLSASLHDVAFQPIMVDIFRSTDGEMALMFGVIAALSIIPPFLITMWARYTQDRNILLTGLLVKVIGMVLYLPIFGYPNRTQILIGYVLILKASVFFVTAILSLVTKTVNNRKRSMALGYIWSVAGIGPAITQLLLREMVIDVWRSWKFAMMIGPGVVGLIMTIYPKWWEKMDEGKLESA